MFIFCRVCAIELTSKTRRGVRRFAMRTSACESLVYADIWLVASVGKVGVRESWPENSWDEGAGFPERQAIGHFSVLS